MDMYPRYKSKFGYQIGNNQIDSYGIANNVLRKDIGDNRNNWATK